MPWLLVKTAIASLVMNLSPMFMPSVVFGLKNTVSND